MKPEIWTPHVTVAALVERDGRFLVIEEETSTGLRINQPAGHLEAGETLADAVIRETLEETAHPFVPTALVGVYLAHYERPGSAGATYLRFTFCGTAGERIVGEPLQQSIPAQYHSHPVCVRPPLWSTSHLRALRALRSD